MKKVIVSFTLPDHIVSDLDYMAAKESRSRSSMAVLLRLDGMKVWEQKTGDFLPVYEEGKDASN